MWRGRGLAPPATRLMLLPVMHALRTHALLAVPSATPPFRHISPSMAVPIVPQDILDFWFGEGVWGSGQMREAARAKMPLWWGIEVDLSGPISLAARQRIDEECRTFTSLVREAGQGDLQAEPAWQSDEGLYAQMLLCDQVSRNCFRGTSEAYAYDGRAVELARTLVAKRAYEQYELPQFTFLITPAEHSELVEDHEMNLRLLDVCRHKFGAQEGTLKQLEKAVWEHKEVIDRFGRFPHRNQALGRTSSREEEAWLADRDNLPGWAR